MMPIVATISTENPVLRDLPPGRWLACILLCNRMGTAQLIVGGKCVLDITVGGWGTPRLDHVITSPGGPAALVTGPRIHGRKAPDLTLTLTAELTREET